MKRVAAVLALLFAFLTPFVSAYAVQEVTLKDVPPLQPLHNCKHSDGTFAMQSDPCGSDMTEFSSIMQRNPDGTQTYLPLGATMENAATYAASTPAPAEQPAASAPAAKEELTPEAKKEIMGDFRKRMLKWLLFALAIAVVAKLLKRSFILWFILGFVLRMVLVAANVMAF
jgi:hypothetical protein